MPTRLAQLTPPSQSTRKTTAEITSASSSRARFAPTNATNGVALLRPGTEVAEQLAKAAASGGRAGACRPGHREPEVAEPVTERTVALAAADDEDLVGSELAEPVLDREQRIGVARLGDDVRVRGEDPLRLESARACLGPAVHLVGREPVERPDVRRRDEVDVRVSTAVLGDCAGEQGRRHVAEHDDEEVQPRSSRRRIFPVRVFGSSSRKAISRGYL